MPLLELKAITKAFGPKEVLGGIDLVIESGQRVALIGKNGVGKSTLVKIALGTLEADSGSRQCTESVGYLPQEWQGDLERSVESYLKSALGPLEAIREEMELLEERMARGQEADLERYGELQESFERRGGYSSGHRLDEVIEGVGLEKIERSRPVSSLSGGEQSRLMLARLLLLSPDLLILDEPTNHLDLEALEWLEEQLKRYSGALLVISHDRRFLDVVAERIVELRPDGLRTFYGNYHHYLQERERLYRKELDAYRRWQAEVKELRETIKKSTFNQAAPKGPKDRNIMAYDRHGELAQKGLASKIGRLRQRLEELEKEPLSPPRRQWALAYRLEPQPMVSERVVNVAGLTVVKGERVVITGPNGCGKTTLLDQIYKGDALAPSAVVGYLDQMQQLLDQEKTVLENYAKARAGLESELRAELHKFGLFGGEEVFQKVATLSSGQKQKLQLARCIAMGANLLLLDEPTNHLDLESIERLEGALLESGVTVVAVSHDRWFVEKVATRVETLRNSEV